MEYSHKFSKVYLNTKIFARLTVISSGTGSSTDCEYRQRPTSRELLVFVLVQNGLDGRGRPG